LRSENKGTFKFKELPFLGLPLCFGPKLAVPKAPLNFGKKVFPWKKGANFPQTIKESQ